MTWNRPLIVLLLALVLIMAWWLNPTEQDTVRRTRLLMGTTVEIVAYGPAKVPLDQAVNAAFEEMARLDLLLSDYREGSDVSRINRATSSLAVANETVEVLGLGLQYAEASSGAFDPTLGRLKALWDIGGPHQRVPSAEEIAAVLATTGYAALELDGFRVRKSDPAMTIDLGGIAKGYIVDRAVEVLQKLGVTSAAVNAGGDMYLLGRRGERPWRIGIQHPRKHQAVVATLGLEDRAVVTSGDYEKFFEHEGVRYHHLFDPRTGTPARKCQSVTVISAHVADADALATALFVLGPEDGLRLLSGYPGSEAMLVDVSGEVFYSPGWSHYQSEP